ncbi:hypothetical protein R1sor_019181 [Riccia sorocarpa]|uniref:Uncharacterized protein n=1 Tax=Riccia sorocarpa TaxID=122646 RepID=A0ABD3IF38_9MARC
MASESGSKEGLKRAIRSKPQWEVKVFDESISKNYKLEAQEQGISRDLVDTALEQLREEASYILHNRSADGGAGSNGSGSSSSGRGEELATPSVNCDELKKSADGGAGSNGSGSSSSGRGEELETPSVNCDELKKLVSSAHDKIQAGQDIVEPLEEKGNSVWVVD